MNLKNNYYILRHGKTEYQKEKAGFTYPRKPLNSVPLAKEGAKQVKERAKEIKELDINKIYSSDFLRTKQTAKIVKEGINFDKDIIFDKRFRDLDLGVWHDKKKEEFYNKFPINKEFFNNSPEQGESWNEVEKRMIDAIKEIDKNNKNANILIISHGDPLWLLEGKIKNKSKEELIKAKKTKIGFIKPAELIKLN
ncbi:MAG: histidine phosphatase family protein [Patescibacteria group bacterium]